MKITKLPPSPQAQVMLKVLQEAVRKTLDRKRRLGQYSVTWKDGSPVIAGDDAPKRNG